MKFNMSGQERNHVHICRLVGDNFIKINNLLEAKLAKEMMASIHVDFSVSAIFRK